MDALSPSAGPRRILSIEDLALESDTDPERIRDLVRIGVLDPSPAGTFVPADVLRARTASVFLDAGARLDQLELATREGLVTFEYVDQFYLEPPPPSGRTYGEFQVTLGPRARHLPAIYHDLGMAEPGPSSMLSTEEERVLTEFVEAWSAAGDEETYARAARLIGQAVRLLNEGWSQLFMEKLTLAPEQIESIDEAVERTLEPARRVAKLAPRMFLWLQQRLLEHALSAGAIERFEEGLARVGLAPPPPPTLPAIAFVDLSGYTRMTEERGDQHAVRYASALHDHADRCARRHRGRLVKLLGDGVMLHFPKAPAGVTAALDLVDSLSATGLPAHAGLHAGPVIERDRDLFGRTVNLAARISGEAGPGEVVVSEAVAEAAEEAEVTFEPVGAVTLKGISEPMSLFLASR